MCRVVKYLMYNNKFKKRRHTNVNKVDPSDDKPLLIERRRRQGPRRSTVVSPIH